jgi:hypothetical protein
LPVSEDHTAIWNGSTMIVWGDSRVNSGGQYNPDTGTWNNISSADAPDVNCRHNGARVYRRNGASSKCSKNSLGHPFQNVIFTSFLH